MPAKKAYKAKTVKKKKKKYANRPQCVTVKYCAAVVNYTAVHGVTMARKKKNSLVNNINKRKKAGTSRSKKNSTISPKAYKQLKKGWKK